MVQLPLPLAVSVPAEEALPSRYRLTMLLGSAVPENFRLVVMLVISSALETPLSLPGLRSGVLGADGLVLSMTNVLFVAVEFGFPLESCPLMVTVAVPSLPGGIV